MISTGSGRKYGKSFQSTSLRFTCLVSSFCSGAALPAFFKYLLYKLVCESQVLFLVKNFFLVQLLTKYVRADGIPTELNCGSRMVSTSVIKVA